MPKSPIGYNGSNFCAGNVNMKGKKTKTMRCLCCTCFDFRDKYDEKQTKKYVAESVNDWVAQLDRAPRYEREG